MDATISFLNQANKCFIQFLEVQATDPAAVNTDFLVHTPADIAKSLEEIGSGQERRFAALLPSPSVMIKTLDDFEAVTLSELLQVVLRLRPAAPGPDGVTSNMIKILFAKSSDDLPALVNH